MNFTAIEQPVIQAIYPARCAALFFAQTQAPVGKPGPRQGEHRCILTDPGVAVCRKTARLSVSSLPVLFKDRHF